MGLTDYLRVALRHVILIALCAVTAAVTAFLLARAQPEQFRSTAKFLVGPSPRLSQGELSQAVDALGRRAIVPTLAEVITSGQTFQVAASRVGLPPEAVPRYSVSAVGIPDANVVEARVTGRRADTAAALLDAIGSEATTSFESLYKVYSVQRLNVPDSPRDPVAPKPARNALVASVFGAVIGFGTALARDRWRTARALSVKTRPAPEISRSEGSPALASGPPEFDDIYWRIRSLKEALSPADESIAYRRLRARLSETNLTWVQGEPPLGGAVATAGSTPSSVPNPEPRDEEPANQGSLPSPPGTTPDGLG